MSIFSNPKWEEVAQLNRQLKKYDAQIRHVEKRRAELLAAHEETGRVMANLFLRLQLEEQPRNETPGRP
ncbi:MAG: hypothetical protein WA188_14700 [Terriglobales bacterium]